MNEDPTQNLPQASFEERVLTTLSAIRTEQTAIRADVAALGERLSALEEKVDRRLQETRPMWEGVQAQIRQLDGKFDVVLRDLYELRSDQMFINRRVDQLERERPR
jgi:predicted  nucleic acid-binding Zn-ribbon protein